MVLRGILNQHGKFSNRHTTTFSNVPHTSMPLKMKIFSLTLNFWCRETTMRFSSDACSGRTKKRRNSLCRRNFIQYQVKNTFSLTEIINPNVLLNFFYHSYLFKSSSSVCMSSTQCLLAFACVQLESLIFQVCGQLIESSVFVVFFFSSASLLSDVWFCGLFVFYQMFACTCVYF